MKLRVGLIGLGSAWESRYGPALRALGDRFEIRAVCEPVAHLAVQAGRQLNVAQVDGFRALARREDVDALMLFSPQWYGCLPVFAACDAGKAVFCATGLGADPALARRLYDRVEQAGIAFMAELARRHAPATVRLKELIATRLGQPRLLFCHTRRPVEQRQAGGCGEEDHERHRNELVELVDWCRYVVGRDPTSVFGMSHAAAEPASEPDYRMMTLDFATDGRLGSGATAQISCGRYLPGAWHEAIVFRPPAGLQVACKHGVAFVDLPSTLIWFDSAGRHMESLDHERPMGELLLAQFHRSVTSLVHNTAGLHDAYLALSTVMAAEQSHEDGCRKML